jgi:hypothetical protein
MDLHRARIDVGLERIVAVWQFGKCEWHILLREETFIDSTAKDMGQASGRLCSTMMHSRFLIPNSQFLLLCAFLLASCKPVPLTEMKIPLAGESVIDTIDGEPYRYFRYETMEATEADVAKISGDGKRIGGKRMRWEGPVHIYTLRKRIVIYVGSNPKVISTIEEVFGEQIAGDPIPEEGEGENQEI